VALAVCALFDAAGERLIRGLWARLEDAGVGSLASHTHGHHHPHLSLAVLREWELDCVRDTLGRLPDGGGFPVTLTVASAALVDTATGQTWPLPGIP